MKKKLNLLIAAIIIVIASCNNNTDEKKAAEKVLAQIADTLKGPLDSLVKTLATTNKCRVTLRIANDSGAFYYSGYDGREDKPITDFTGTIDIGSGTKMFTAASVLQLIEENKLSLQDKLTAVLPNDTLYKDLLIVNGKNYIDSVKIVNLLNHSSGFPEYFIEGDDEKEFTLHGDSTLRFTPYQLIAMAKQHKNPGFTPGSSFKYCNVNYILLGMIIEKLTGQNYQQYFQEHIIGPLGLKHTYFSSLNPPVNRASGHFKGKIAVMPATMAGPAGEIISDLDDMQKFISEWGSGKLFAKPTTIEMLKRDNFKDMLAPIIKYGMGVVNMMDVSYGHAGQTFGFQSYMGSLNNHYSFAIGVDDAVVSIWEPAIQISTLLDSRK